MKTKICPTCKKEFVSKRSRQMYCSKTCVQQNSITKEKMAISQQKTYNKKYGVSHPMKTVEVVNKFKSSMREKYGVEHALQNDVFVKKSFDSKKEKYGDGNYNNINQIKQTCLFKFGVDNVRKSKIIIDQCNETVRKKHYQHIIEYCKRKNVTSLFSENEYSGYHFSKKYQFQCLDCNKKFETDIYKLHHIFCEVCHPTDADTLENEIFKYVTSVLPSNVIIKRNDRTILMGKELDIYIPSLKLAIEINGLYWHSENARGTSKFYHLNKYKSSLFHGIRLIHIFENEWIHKKEIVKSILKNTFQTNQQKTYARKCEVRLVRSCDKDFFLESNHIQGKDKSSIGYGLYYQNELLALMTFGKSRYDKKVEYEMIRFCTKLEHTVVGGASKLFTHFIKNQKPNSILSYSDKRFFNGGLYGQLGFKFHSITPPNYHYISSDYKTLYSRMKFQKHKLKNILKTYDGDLSEWENMKNNGFDRIWDCGHSKWIWKNPKFFHQ